MSWDSNDLFKVLDYLYTEFKIKAVKFHANNRNFEVYHVIDYKRQHLFSLKSSDDLGSSILKFFNKNRNRHLYDKVEDVLYELGYFGTDYYSR